MPENTAEVLGQRAVPSHLRKPAALSKEEKDDWRNRDGAPSEKHLSLPSSDKVKDEMGYKGQLCPRQQG